MIDTTCPVCGRHKFKEDGQFEVCPVCGWEDDAYQREFPDSDYGANNVTLNRYKELWKKKDEA